MKITSIKGHAVAIPLPTPHCTATSGGVGQSLRRNHYLPNGYCVETFPNAERDPLWERLYTYRAQLRDGALHLGDEPGFGFGIDWKAVERYRA